VTSAISEAQTEFGGGGVALMKTETSVDDRRALSSSHPRRQLLLGFVAMMLVVGGLLGLQLVRHETWVRNCVKDGGMVVKATDDAAPFVAPGARTIYNCDGPSGTLSTWR
jgi:hypothetical protein